MATIYNPPCTGEAAFLIKSREGYYWRDRARGYTSDLAEAGVFGQRAADAIRSPSNADRLDRVIPLGDVQSDLERMQAQIAEKLEYVERAAA